MVPRGEPASVEAPAEGASDAFGAIDFDAIGLDLEGPQRSRLIVPPKRSSIEPPANRSDPEAEEETKVAGLGALATAIAATHDTSPPSSRSRAPRSASDVVPREDRVDAMRELYAKGNAEAAFAIASELDRALRAGFAGGSEPDDRTAIASSPVSGLVAFTSHKVPRLVMSSQDIPSLPIDPRAAFIVGHVDGIQSMGDILDICAMPESEALELFALLQSLGVIALD